MSCDFPGKLSALEKVNLRKLLADPALKQQVDFNERMYEDLIANELIYKLPRLDAEGRPVYDANGLVYETRDTPVTDIVRRIVDWMLKIDARMIGLLDQALQAGRVAMGLEDGVCLLCKYYVDKIYGRLAS